jgi:hypothetical protein
VGWTALGEPYTGRDCWEGVKYGTITKITKTTKSTTIPPPMTHGHTVGFATFVDALSIILI